MYYDDYTDRLVGLRKSKEIIVTDDAKRARQQILAAALALFAEKGFGKTSINDIVRASGLSKGGVYWHFASKDEIVAAIFDQFFEAQLTVLKVILMDTNLGATDKLMQLIKLSGNDLETMVSQFPSSLEFYALASHDKPLRDHLVQYFAMYQDYIEQLVMQGIADGEWKKVDPKATALTIIALFEGALLIWGVMPTAFHLSDQLENAITMLLEGLKQPN
ncbi:MAG: TetR/AcrR family transcriptional regulator [Chloroflexota bacterium]